MKKYGNPQMTPSAAKAPHARQLTCQSSLPFDCGHVSRDFCNVGACFCSAAVKQYYA
jgi:hypothetical protein